MARISFHALPIAVLTAVIVTVFPTPATAQADVALNGKLLVGTCEVAASSQQLTVSLGKRHPQHFARETDGSEWVPFTITLEKCTVGFQGLEFVFDGSPHARYPYLFDIETGQPGQAAGVAINIQRADSNTLVEPGKAVSWARTDFNGDYPYQARYMRTGNMQLGTANATVLFTLIYR